MPHWSSRRDNQRRISPPEWSDGASGRASMGAEGGGARAPATPLDSGNVREERGGGKRERKKKKGGREGAGGGRGRLSPPPFPPNLAPPLDGACIPRYGQLSSWGEYILQSCHFLERTQVWPGKAFLGIGSWIMQEMKASSPGKWVLVCAR